MARLYAVVGLAACATAMELTGDTFEAEVFNSGKNAFVKFLAPWWGHCKSMKPAWDSLMKEYSEHPSVLIGDVDCTVHSDLCSDMGVGGYPTIKYWTDGAGKEDGQPYNGGRDLAALQRHVTDNLLPKCDAKDPEGSGCDDQEIAYVSKMNAKGADAIAKELTRLEGMAGGSMKPDKKAWLAKRVHILKGLSD